MALWATIVMSTGYAFMTLTTPSEEQLYASLSPDLKRQFDREREGMRKANDKRLESIMRDRNLDRPAWMTGPDIKKPEYAKKE